VTSRVVFFGEYRYGLKYEKPSYTVYVLFIKIKCALLKRTATRSLRRVSMCLLEQVEIRCVYLYVFEKYCNKIMGDLRISRIWLYVLGCGAM